TVAVECSSCTALLENKTPTLLSQSLVVLYKPTAVPTSRSAVSAINPPLSRPLEVPSQL
ncbi:unnamed protein product, partial [Pylaiella littoralis]